MFVPSGVQHFGRQKRCTLDVHGEDVREPRFAESKAGQSGQQHPQRWTDGWDLLQLTNGWAISRHGVTRVRNLGNSHHSSDIARIARYRLGESGVPCHGSFCVPGGCWSQWLDGGRLQISASHSPKNVWLVFGVVCVELTT